MSTPRVCTRNLESLLRLDSPCQQPVRSSNYIRFNYVCFTGPQAPFRRKTTDSKRIGALTGLLKSRDRAFERVSFKDSLATELHLPEIVCSRKAVRKGCAVYIFHQRLFVRDIFAKTFFFERRGTKRNIVSLNHL